MTPDREQIRRDTKARDRLAVWLDDSNAGYATLAGLRFDVRALLAELEQAEQRITYLEDAQRREIQARDKAVVRAEQAERQRDEAIKRLAELSGVDTRPIPEADLERAARYVREQGWVR